MFEVRIGFGFSFDSFGFVFLNMANLYYVWWIVLSDERVVSMLILSNFETFFKRTPPTKLEMRT